MMNHLVLPVLVLNKAWHPVAVASVKRSIVQVMSDAANFMDHDTYILHDMYGWMSLLLEKGDEGIGMANRADIRIPEVIVLKKYDKFPEREVKLTRRNIMVRDKFTCQYYGKVITAKDATIDHVIPQSRGGKTIWDNVVLSSKEANRKKADRTPQEAGMLLRKRPSKPQWSPMYSRFARLSSTSKVPVSWKKFVPETWKADQYWNVEVVED